MAIPGLPLSGFVPPVPPATRAEVNGPVTAPPLEAPMVSLPKLPHDLLGTLRHRWSQVGQWLLTPYLNQVAKIGVKEFVQPNAHRPNGAPPSSIGLPYETMSFPSQDGTPLKGWYIPAEKPTDQTVVLAPGHGSEMSKEVRRFAPWLHKAGYNVVSFDFRNSGGSGGTQTTMGFEERGDLNAAISQAEARGGKNIAVLGVSMGAATAIAEAGNDPRVKTIVADCPYDTLQHAVEPRVRATTFNLGPFKHLHIPLPHWAALAIMRHAEQATGHTSQSPGGSLESIEPLRTLPKLGKRPIFFIHGAQDQGTPPASSETLAKAAPNGQLWIVPGAGHDQSYETATAQYRARVLDFLGKNL